MKKFKHTPGPWMIKKSKRNLKLGKQWQYTITTTPPVTQPNLWAPIVILYGKPNESDAYLIAAAPEMLEALQRVMPTGHRTGDCYSDDYMGRCVCGLEMIEAVIAKATGKEES
jgi:hypothetical protein